jgi:hypothetical protein
MSWLKHGMGPQRSIPVATFPKYGVGVLSALSGELEGALYGGVGSEHGGLDKVRDGRIFVLGAGERADVLTVSARRLVRKVSDLSPGADVGGVSPVPVQMWAG